MPVTDDIDLDPPFVYTGGGPMSKKLIDIDDELLEEAKRLLGASTYRETVNAGLREIVARDAREREIARFLADDDHDWGVGGEAWR